MSFELLLKPLEAQRRPWVLFLFTFVIATIAIFLSYRIFPGCSSILIITFSIIPLIPIMTKLLELEELRLEKTRRWWRLKNYRVIRTYVFLFLGFVIAFSLWFTFLPSEKGNELFKQQVLTLQDDGGDALGKECDTGLLSGHIGEYEITDCSVKDYYNDAEYEYLVDTPNKTYIFLPGEERFVEESDYMQSYYFWHNLKLLVFVFLTSFIFGAGALFVLVWNASILGVYIGEMAHRFALVASFGKLGGYFSALQTSLLRILPHGIPEFLGFFIAAIAGGILSVVFVRHKHLDARSLRILGDSAILLGVSVALIFIASVIESLL